jgi:hypothetical protein
MAAIFYWLDKLSDLLALPFSGLPDRLQLILLSLISAVVLLLVFKRISRQEKIRFHKNKIIGYILEMGVFRDQTGRILLNQLRLLQHNCYYLWYVATPFLLLMIPVIFTSVQLDSRLGYRPLQNGETFIIRATLDRRAMEKRPELIDNVHCETSGGVVLETPSLRIGDEGRIFWRARVADDSVGNYVCFVIAATGETTEKAVATGRRSGQIAPVMTKADSWKYGLYFAEGPIAAGSPLSEIRIGYRRANLSFFSITAQPVVWFFILTILFGLLVKPWLRVNF